MDIKQKGAVKSLKSTKLIGLPNDVLNDLKHVIKYLRKSDNSGINRNDLRTIIHNFGCFNIKKNDFEKLMKKYTTDSTKQSYTDLEVVNFITTAWCNEEKIDEPSECFKMFDKQ